MNLILWLWWIKYNLRYIPHISFMSIFLDVKWYTLNLIHSFKMVVIPKNASCFEYTMLVNIPGYENATLSTYELKTTLGTEFLLGCFFLFLTACLLICSSVKIYNYYFANQDQQCEPFRRAMNFASHEWEISCCQFFLTQSDLVQTSFIQDTFHQFQEFFWHSTLYTFLIELPKAAKPYARRLRRPRSLKRMQRRDAFLPGHAFPGFSCVCTDIRCHQNLWVLMDAPCWNSYLYAIRAK